MAIKFVLVEIVLVETVLVGDPLYSFLKHYGLNLWTGNACLLHFWTILSPGMCSNLLTYLCMFLHILELSLRCLYALRKCEGSMQHQLAAKTADLYGDHIFLGINMSSYINNKIFT